MTFKSNVKELKSHVAKSPIENRPKIDQIIELYENKQIVNFKTASNAVMLLASKNKNTIKSRRADKEYEK